MTWARKKNEGGLRCDSMRVGIIHHRDCFTALIPAADNDSLRKLRQRMLLRFSAPFLRGKRHLLVDSAQLGLGGKPRRTVLTVAHGLAFDIVEVKIGRAHV